MNPLWIIGLLALSKKKNTTTSNPGTSNPGNPGGDDPLDRL